MSNASFKPGHDQRLRIDLERRAGGTEGLRALVERFETDDSADLERDRLKSVAGDAINALLSAAAMNFHKLHGAFWLYFLRCLFRVWKQSQLRLRPVGLHMQYVTA